MNSMRETIGRIIRAGMALGGIGIVPAGCADRPPTGQVLASVDGDDVTKRDLAVEAALTRLGQLDPTVLIAADGYRFNGKTFDRTAEVAERFDAK